MLLALMQCNLDVIASGHRARPVHGGKRYSRGARREADLCGQREN